MTGLPESAHKVLVYGEYGAGKSTFALSVVEYLRDVRKLKPEQVYIGIIDNDNGMEELLEAGQVPPEWMPCLDRVVCSNWDQVTSETDRIIKKGKDNQVKNGKIASWIIADNVGTAWNWTRDQYSVMVHGKYEELHAADVRQELVQQGTPNKMAPTFDGRKEYPIITNMHARWADGIKLSGLNFMFLSPKSSFKQDEESEEVVKAKGQKDNDGRVSHIIHLYFEEDQFGGPQNEKNRKYLADLEKNRGERGAKLFRRAPDLTYAKFRRWLERNSPSTLKAKAEAEAAKKAAEEAIAKAQTSPETPKVQT